MGFPLIRSETFSMGPEFMEILYLEYNFSYLSRQLLLVVFDRNFSSEKFAKGFGSVILPKKWIVTDVELVVYCHPTRIFIQLKMKAVINSSLISSTNGRKNTWSLPRTLMTLWSSRGLAHNLVGHTMKCF